jgi:hypothetical protein
MGRNDFKIIETSGSDKSFDELCLENKWLFELTLAYARKLKNKRENDTMDTSNNRSHGEMNQ